MDGYNLVFWFETENKIINLRKNSNSEPLNRTNDNLRLHRIYEFFVSKNQIEKFISDTLASRVQALM